MGLQDIEDIYMTLEDNARENGGVGDSQVKIRNHRRQKDPVKSVGNISSSNGIQKVNSNNYCSSPAADQTTNGCNIEANTYNENNVSGNDMIPSNYSIYLKTWGCSHNSSDSEYMAGILNTYGFRITDDKENAHVWILNSCTVKGPAEQHFKNEIENGLGLDKKVILAGCVPQGEPRAPFVKGLSVIGVQQIDKVIQVVEEALQGNVVRFIGKKKENGVRLGGATLNLPKIRKNPLVEIIPVSTGCLNQCTYCKTKHARGELASYPEDEIVGRAQQAFQEGVREIWLTSEDTGAYGIDLGTNIVNLLKKLVNVIPDDCMLRVGMTNPPYILNHLDDIADILDHPRVYAFLHVPVQSGSDCVLSDMKREYCVDDFQKVVDLIKARIPDATIATDIICGFPTETEQDFQETFNLCKKNKFKVLYVNQFYPRNGTPAARMKRIDTSVVKTRTKRIGDLFTSYLPYENRIGQVYKILITEISHDKRFYVGHNKFYEQILVEKIPSLMGKWATVKIVSVCKHSMTGKIIQQNQDYYIYIKSAFFVMLAIFVLFIIKTKFS